jgi:hypothetical protein
LISMARVIRLWAFRKPLGQLVVERQREHPCRAIGEARSPDRRSQPPRSGNACLASPARRSLSGPMHSWTVADRRSRSQLAGPSGRASPLPRERSNRSEPPLLRSSRIARKRRSVHPDTRAQPGPLPTKVRQPSRKRATPGQPGREASARNNPMNAFSLPLSVPWVRSGRARSAQHTPPRPTPGTSRSSPPCPSPSRRASRRSRALVA